MTQLRREKRGERREEKRLLSSDDLPRNPSAFTPEARHEFP